MDMEFLWGACPIDEAEINGEHGTAVPVRAVSPEFRDLPELAARVLGHYHCCDQSPAGFQFDSTVQGRTVVGPFGGLTGRMPNNAFVSAPLRGEKVGVVSTVAYNPFYGEMDPAGLARLAMVEAVAKAVAVGGDPTCLALCDNFYTPRSTPEVNWALVRMVETIAELSVVFGMPFISGKDSSSGTMQCRDGRIIEVPPTLVVATLGRVPDVDRCLTKPLRRPGDQLVLVGDLWPNRLGGSVYLDTLGQGDRLHDGGQAWAARQPALWRQLFALGQRSDNPIKAVATVAEGGLLARLFEMAYGGGLGAEIDLGAFSGERWDGVLFAEAVGAFVLEIPPTPIRLGSSRVFPAEPFGRVTAEQSLSFHAAGRSIAVPMAGLVEAWERPFPEIVG